MKKTFKTIIIISIALIAIAGGAYYLYLLDSGWLKADTKEIVRAKAEIPIGKKIEESDLYVDSVKNQFIVDGAITKKDDVVGKESVVLIKKGEQLTKEKYDDMSLLATKADEITVSIPESWVVNMPDTLRRKDRITIWGFQSGATKLITRAIDGSVIDETPTNQNADFIRSSIKAGTPLLKDVVVAYYRDGMNGEVASANAGSGANEDRLKGTSVPKKLEILVPEKEFQILSDAVSLGYLLTIGYK